MIQKLRGKIVAMTMGVLILMFLLAYGLAPHLGETGIWMAIPIGWALADAVGLGYMRRSLHGLEPAAD